MLLTQKKVNYNYSNTDIKKDEKQKKNYTACQFVTVYIAITVLVGLLLVLFIGQSVKITHLNYKLNNLNQQLTELRDKNHQLKLNIARNSSLTKIERIARQKLNMIEPEKMEILVLNNNNNNIRETEETNENNILFLEVFANFFDRIRTVKARSPE